jgi:alpha-tubulin suppressor-like RCC1 family protein
VVNYNVKRSTVGPLGPYVTIATLGNVLTYNDSGLTDGTTYYYVVSAVNGPMQANSNVVQAVPTVPPATTTVAGGRYHSLRLRIDGTVLTWGQNQFGQLGNGTTIDSAVPVQVLGLPGAVTAIAGGVEHSLALISDGTVWAWGGNDFGELGNGTIVNSSLPVKVVGLPGPVTAIAAGQDHSMALINDGSLWTWGSNTFGNLGNGQFPNSPVPVQVIGLPAAVIAIAGNLHSMALLADGSLWAWGRYSSGELGNVTIPPAMVTVNVPLQVTPPTTGTISSIAAGFRYSMILMKDGTVWTWGAPDVGVMGNGTTTNGAPGQVLGLTKPITAIAAGANHALALMNDGTLWAWGYNPDGELGNGQNTNALLPVQVLGLSGVTSVAAGGFHSFALEGTPAQVWTWGRNQFGELGNGTTTSSNVPIHIP